jgi:hypothetical protein
MYNETSHCCCRDAPAAVVDTGNDFDADGYWNYLDDDSIDRNSTMNSTAMTMQKTTINQSKRSVLNVPSGWNWMMNWNNDDADDGTDWDVNRRDNVDNDNYHR